MANKLHKHWGNIVLLLLWGIAMGLYLYIGQAIPLEKHFFIGCPLDEMLPFLPIFVIPYVSWYFFLFYTAFHCIRKEKRIFRQFMGFTLYCYGVAISIFVLYPTAIAFRPPQLEDGLLGQIVGWIYTADNPTNVLPSLHVLLSLGIAFAMVRTRKWGGIWGKLLWWTVALLICASTVLIKQHSVLDILAAIPIAAVGYLLFFFRK